MSATSFVTRTPFASRRSAHSASIAATFLVLVTTSLAAAQPTPPSPPAAPAAPAADTTGPPRLPPFAGSVVSFDRRGARVVACVDRSTVPPRTGGPAPPQPQPATPKAPPAYRIWLIEREVMQELMTTGGLCHPVWSPDGKTFLAAGARGLFAFTEPQYEARVLMLTAPLPPPPSPPSGHGPGAVSATPSAGQPAADKAGAAIVKTTEPAPIPFSQTSWSPSGGRVAFVLSADGATKVRVIDAKSGSTVFTRDQSAKLVQWGADDRTLVIDGARVSLP